QAFVPTAGQPTSDRAVRRPVRMSRLAQLAVLAQRRRLTELSCGFAESGDGPGDPDLPRVHGASLVGVSQALTKLPEHVVLRRLCQNADCRPDDARSRIWK